MAVARAFDCQGVVLKMRFAPAPAIAPKVRSPGAIARACWASRARLLASSILPMSKYRRERCIASHASSIGSAEPRELSDSMICTALSSSSTSRRAQAVATPAATLAASFGASSIKACRNSGFPFSIR